jgi:hypothetical protein
MCSLRVASRPAVYVFQMKMLPSADPAQIYWLSMSGLKMARDQSQLGLYSSQLKSNLIEDCALKNRKKF